MMVLKKALRWNQLLHDEWHDLGAVFLPDEKLDKW